MKFSTALFLLLLLSGLGLAQPSVQIHGYLTQGYARATDYPIFGIPVSGTADYRNLALQFRATMNPNTALVVQLSHKRLGRSPVMSLEESVELDWGFFEYRFAGNFVLKGGLIQLPFGIFNEIRDVGVLLPFYQVPYMPYGESNYTSETVSGASIGYAGELGDSWGISLDLYAGEWTWTEWFIIRTPLNPSEPTVIVEEPHIRKAFGTQLWLETPVSGLRFGAGGYGGEISGGLSFGVLGKSDIYVGNVSVDGDFERFFARSEYSYYYIEPAAIRAKALYFQGGYRFLDRFTLVGQAGRYNINSIPLAGISLGSSELDFFKEVALGFNLALRHNLVLKLENHWTRGFITETASETPGVYLESRKTNYAIISVSTSF
ncbi:MAG TPA: hypothetical protein PKV71_12885 [Calditrichia bacterium]|nr:hypothetical protein [Calditrichota bacterium]HQU73867.1 hypothetical protein [Calditrichia bacterium]HQV32772.1 hypothetical protein [Calditrichia bacterium]